MGGGKADEYFHYAFAVDKVNVSMQTHVMYALKKNWQLFVRDAKNNIWTNEGRNKKTDRSEGSKCNV